MGVKWVVGVAKSLSRRQVKNSTSAGSGAISSRCPEKVQARTRIDKGVWRFFSIGGYFGKSIIIREFTPSTPLYLFPYREKSRHPPKNLQFLQKVALSRCNT